jgi:hypothetical protein
VENLLSLIGFEFTNSLYIKHPNPVKNIQINCPSVIGNEIAIEKSLAKYTGQIIVGESMVLVYCLLNPNELSKITDSISYMLLNWEILSIEYLLFFSKRLLGIQIDSILALISNVLNNH